MDFYIVYNYLHMNMYIYIYVYFFIYIISYHIISLILGDIITLDAPEKKITCSMGNAQWLVLDVLDGADGAWKAWKLGAETC